MYVAVMNEAKKKEKNPMTMPEFCGITAHMGIVLGVVAVVALWIVWRQSKWGYEISAIDDNPQAARYAGMPIVRNIVIRFNHE
jgi:simple sugar transport system permease protein